MSNVRKEGRKKKRGRNEGKNKRRKERKEGERTMEEKKEKGKKEKQWDFMIGNFKQFKADPINSDIIIYMCPLKLRKSL